MLPIFDRSSVDLNEEFEVEDDEQDYIIEEGLVSNLSQIGQMNQIKPKFINDQANYSQHSFRFIPRNHSKTSGKSMVSRKSF